MKLSLVILTSAKRNTIKREPLETTIISTVSLKLSKDEEAVVSIKKKSHKPGFIMIGNGTTNKRDVTSIDLLTEVANMASNEKLCFFAIKESIVFDPWDNRLIYQTKVDISKYTKSMKSKFSDGYTSLNRKNLVRRVSKGIYMINPNALIPNDFPRELAVWDSLDTNKTKG